MESTKLYIGQVVDDNYWKDNNTSKKWNNVDEIGGWGRRYKVRINGIHSENKAQLPDESLPWLEVMYPVTAGTGHKGGYQTPNISQGSIVVVLITENTAPFIIGCLGNNEQTILSRGEVFDKGCIPFSGFKSNERPPDYSTSGGKVIESSANAQHNSSDADQNQKKDGTETTPLTTPVKCEAAPMSEIQNKIKKFIKEITAAKNFIETQKTSLGKPINENGQQYSIDEYLSAKIQEAAKLISAPLKTLITQIQQFVTNTINDKLKSVYYILFPNEQQKVKEKVETANDLIACLFRKIIRNLIKMCGNFLSSASNYLVNTPLCAVENFVGGLIGKITGLLTSGIDAILSPLKAVLGVFDVVEEILGFVEDLLSSISCDEEPSCAKIKEWSVWDGPESIVGGNTDTSGLISKMKSFAANVQQVVDPNTFDFNLDFSDVFQSTCNVGAIACGPPIVQFSGGGGIGASGNAIVSSLGQIIGVDITNFGKGYTSAPLVKFYDSCGKGSGAVGRAIIGNVAVQTTTTTTTNGTTANTGLSTTTPGVTSVVITDPGSGYLPAPDGSLGGDGRTLTDPIKSTTAIYPSKSNGQYPVILKLCEVLIEESGFGYLESDQVVIEPANGATAKLSVTSTGAVVKIDVLTKGEGFTEMPSIYIQSQTGYRASLIPRLCVERVGDNLTIMPVTKEKIVNVVDCPGR